MVQPTQLTHVKRRRVELRNLDAMLNRQEEAIFSLIGPAGEVNAYYLTLQQALDMVDPAIDEDGYRGSELYIAIVK